jgi:predicted RNase H-like HicB family nuclease
LELPSRIQEAHAACYHESQIEEAIMDIPVLIQPVPGKGFVARAGSPFDWTAEGSTMDEALANLQAEATRRLSNGTKAAVIAVSNGQPTPDPLALARAKGMVIEAPPGEHPLLKWAGTLDPNDPMVQEWRKAVEEYRREIDADPNR